MATLILGRLGARPGILFASSGFSSKFKLPSVKAYFSTFRNNRPWRVYNNRRNSWNNNPLMQGKNLLYAIMGTNVGVYFCWQYALSDRSALRTMMEHFTLSSFGLFREWRVHTLVTSFFSHNDGFHLFSNMFTLYFFGGEAIYLLGAARFGALYFAGGLVSGFCFALWPYMARFLPRNWPARYRSSTTSRALGASGAVSAVVAWSVLTYPTRVIYLYMILPVPAALFGLGYLAMETYSLYLGQQNVANIAHLSGAAYGALYYALAGRR